MTGLIFDDDGQRLSPTHAVKNGKRYRYYVSTALITGDRGERPVGRRLPVEALTLDRLRGFFSSAKEISDAVAPLGLNASTQQALLERSTLLALRWISLSSLELRELVHCVVQRVEVGGAHISMRLDRMAIVSRLTPEAASSQWLMFFASDDDSVESMAARLGVRRDYLAVQMRLSYLAPQIVRAILLGAYPCELTPTRLKRSGGCSALRQPDAAPNLQQRSTSDGPKTGRRDVCSVLPP
jgi:site-specific DNA recombinase